MNPNSDPLNVTDSPLRAEVKVQPPGTAATGVPAIVSSVKDSVAEMGPIRSIRTLAVINQARGYDCPGCAWPEPHPDDRKRIEFCESGAKAVAEEAMTARADRSFFADHPVADLRNKSDCWLGKAGRLTEPMIRRPGDTHFTPTPWAEALREIATTLRQLDSPDEAVFYTSGRAANEQAYLYQLMARSFGTNNLPDCSNMCHEPTSVALDEAIGVGKGTVRLTDFYEADLIVIAGQNPGTNHPRMLSALEKAKRNGAKMIAVNPLPEAGLLRFKNPQRPRGVVGDGTKLADLHLPIRLGADQALFQLWSRWLLDDHPPTRSESSTGGGIDENFIARYTSGFDAFRDHVRSLDENDLIAAT